MKRFLCLIVGMALVSGCATTQMLKPDKQPELVAKEGKALLVIIRDTFFGGGIVLGVAVGIWRARTSGYSPIGADDAMKSLNNLKFLEIDPNAELTRMDPVVYGNAIAANKTDVKANPDAYREMLHYQGD